jgi:hypothetical protein
VNISYFHGILARVKVRGGASKRVIISNRVMITTMYLAFQTPSTACKKKEKKEEERSLQSITPIIIMYMHTPPTPNPPSIRHTTLLLTSSIRPTPPNSSKTPTRAPRPPERNIVQNPQLPQLGSHSRIPSASPPTGYAKSPPRASKAPPRP